MALLSMGKPNQDVFAETLLALARQDRDILIVTGDSRGSGKLTVVGACEQLLAEQTGSGDLDARHLSAQQATISLRGSGTAVVHAVASADVTLKGNGDVVVHGDPPKRNVSRTGSGEVVFRQ